MTWGSAMAGSTTLADPWLSEFANQCRKFGVFADVTAMPKLQLLPSYRLVADLRAAETDPQLSAAERQQFIEEREQLKQRLMALAAKAFRRVHRM